MFDVLHKVSKLKNNKTARNGVLFATFAFANNGVSFILLLILAKFIEPEGYGHLNLYNTLVQLFTYVVSLGSAGYINICFFKKERGYLLQVINSVLLISITVVTVFVVIVLIGSSSLESAIGLSCRYQLAALSVCFCQVFTNINLDIWRIEEKPTIYGFYSLAMVVLNFILSLLFVVSLQLDWEGRVYAQLSVACLFCIISVVVLFRRRYLTKVVPSWSIFRETLVYGLPLIPHQTAFWLRQSFDRWIINANLGEETVGLYGFAFNFGNIITIVGTAFNATVSVYIFQHLKEGYDRSKKSLDVMSKRLILMYLIVTIIIIVGCHMFIPMLFPNYVGSLSFIVPLSISALSICLYMTYVNYLFYYVRTRQLMYITLSLSLVQVLLSLIFTKYGAVWTATISAVISFLIFMLVYLYSQKTLVIESKKLESLNEL